MNIPTSKGFHDDYEHISDQIEYILENELMPRPNSSLPDCAQYQELKALYNSTFASPCACLAHQSKCFYCSQCLHGGNYTEGTHGDLLLNPNRRVQDLIYECNSGCNCPEHCGNRLLQFGPRSDLCIVQSRTLGPNQLGLVSRKSLSIGSFVCEYAGEILTASEAQQRHTKSKPGDMNYIVCLIERSTGQDGTVYRTFIDPAHRGNIGRYLNHSCDPNCEIVSVRVDGPIPRLGKNFFCLFVFNFNS